jgi:hypothetical protein
MSGIPDHSKSKASDGTPVPAAAFKLAAAIAEVTKGYTKSDILSALEMFSITQNLRVIGVNRPLATLETKKKEAPSIDGAPSVQRPKTAAWRADPAVIAAEASRLQHYNAVKAAGANAPQATIDGLRAAERVLKDAKAAFKAANP